MGQSSEYCCELVWRLQSVCVYVLHIFASYVLSVPLRYRLVSRLLYFIRVAQRDKEMS